MVERSDRLGHVARQAGFGLIVAGVFFSGVVETGPTAWLPYFIEEVVGTNRSFGAVGLLFFALTMVCGRLTVPTLVRRWGVKWIFFGGGLLSCLYLLFGCHSCCSCLFCCLLRNQLGFRNLAL